MYVNDRVLEVSGATRDQLIGHIADLFPEAATGEFHGHLVKAAAERRPAHSEDFYAPWNRWLENRVYQTAEGLVVLATDITHRRQAEESLRQSSERFRITARATGVTLFEQDMNLRYVWLQSPIPDYAVENFVGHGVAFQICWKLWLSKWNAKAGPTRKPRILYLADPNFLVAKDPCTVFRSGLPTINPIGKGGLCRRFRAPHFSVFSLCPSPFL